MKNRFIYTGLFLLIGFVFFSSCKKKYTNDYNEYNPEPVTKTNVDLRYPSSMDSYPVLSKIVSDTPTFKVEGAYIITIDTVVSTDGGKFNFGSFLIDGKTGVITYDNTKGTISAGTYYVAVSVSNTVGVAVVDSALRVNILDVPVNVTANPESVNVSAMDTGVISQLNYEVIGTPSEPVKNVTYTIKPSVKGFSVSDDGKVRKSSDAESGEHTLSFVFSCNLGKKVLNNILSVTVGAPPSLKYVQHDGSTPLTKVTLSPWTAYTTAAPLLEGMSVDQWELLFPDGAPEALVNAVSVAADGSISVAADMNVPQGEYVMGVRVISSGVPLDYNNIFTFNFETRWDETPVLTETFDYATPDGADLVAPFFSSPVNGAQDKSFHANHFVKDDPPRDLHSARLLYAKDGLYDVAMVLTLTNDGSWRNLRIKFGQLYGYGDVAVDFFQRSLYYSYNNEVVDGTFDPANWTLVMANDDEGWLVENLWKTPDPLYDGDLPVCEYQEFSGLDPAQSDIYVCWHFFTEGSDKGAQWYIDDVTVQASKAFDAEEE
jgi:hypothetical protein